MSDCGLEPPSAYSAKFSFLPINNFGVIIYVPPIFVLPPSQSLIQSSIVDSRTMVYASLISVFQPSSVCICKPTLPSNELEGTLVSLTMYDIRLSVVIFTSGRFVSSIFVQSKAIRLSPRQTVIWVQASSSWGLEPSKSA